MWLWCYCDNEPLRRHRPWLCFVQTMKLKFVLKPEKFVDLSLYWTLVVFGSEKMPKTATKATKLVTLIFSYVGDLIA